MISIMSRNIAAFMLIEGDIVMEFVLVSVGRDGENVLKVFAVYKLTHCISSSKKFNKK